MTEYKHLTVTPEIAEEVRSYDGRNDTERLKNWANRKASKSLKETLKEYIREEIGKITINQRTGEIEY